MQEKIHPKYFDSCEIRCSCGHTVIAGSTKEKLRTELCSACHPFYTGQQKLVDTAGRVDKFMEKRKKSAKMHEDIIKRQEAKKKKPEVYVEKVIPQEVIERASGKAPAKTKSKWEAPLGDTPVTETVKDQIEEPKKKKIEKKLKKAIKKPATAKKTIAKKAPAKKPAAKK